MFKKNGKGGWLVVIWPIPFLLVFFQLDQTPYMPIKEGKGERLTYLLYIPMFLNVTYTPVFILFRVKENG